MCMDTKPKASSSLRAEVKNYSMQNSGAVEQQWLYQAKVSAAFRRPGQDKTVRAPGGVRAWPILSSAVLGPGPHCPPPSQDQVGLRLCGSDPQHLEVLSQGLVASDEPKAPPLTTPQSFSSGTSPSPVARPRPSPQGPPWCAGEDLGVPLVSPGLGRGRQSLQGEQGLRRGRFQPGAPSPGLAASAIGWGVLRVGWGLRGSAGQMGRAWCPTA